MSEIDVTQLLEEWRNGSPDALNLLMPELYGDLRRLAASHLRSTGMTLQPTALVNELVLRLLGAQQIQISNRKHFFTTAAKIMRQVMSDQVRAKSREKRGGEWRQVELEAAHNLALTEETTAPALHEALCQLEALDPRMAQIVELRYFVGMEVSEVAELLGLDERTVYRDWAMARAWLKQRIEL